LGSRSGFDRVAHVPDQWNSCLLGILLSPSATLSDLHNTANIAMSDGLYIVRFRSKYYIYWILGSSLEYYGAAIVNEIPTDPGHYEGPYPPPSTSATVFMIN
jgi:hypothetical protein